MQCYGPAKATIHKVVLCLYLIVAISSSIQYISYLSLKLVFRSSSKILHHEYELYKWGNVYGAWLSSTIPFTRILARVICGETIISERLVRWKFPYMVFESHTKFNSREMGLKRLFTRFGFFGQQCSELCTLIVEDIVQAQIDTWKTSSRSDRSNRCAGLQLALIASCCVVSLNCFWFLSFDVFSFFMGCFITFCSHIITR